jgi:hypothetical protein
MAPTGEMMSWQTRLHSSAASSGAVSVNISAISNRPCFSGQPTPRDAARRITRPWRLSPPAREIAFPMKIAEFSGSPTRNRVPLGRFSAIFMCELNS